MSMHASVAALGRPANLAGCCGDSSSPTSIDTAPWGRERSIETMYAEDHQPLSALGAPGETEPAGVSGATAAAWGLLSTASMAASAYHGYKRNESVGWALWWGFCGALFPVITPVIAVAQGFGKRERG